MFIDRMALTVLSASTLEEERDLVELMTYNNMKYISYYAYKDSNLRFLQFFINFRYVYKLIDIFYFLFFIFKVILKIKNKRIFILGAPSFKNRLVAILFQIRFICYLRYLYTSPKNLPYISDKIDFFFKKLNIDTRMTNPYKADGYIVTSSITEDFLIFRNRKLLKKNLKNIGPIWLKDIPLLEKKNIGTQFRIFYITQAFNEHNLFLAHKEQEKIIHELNIQLANFNIELILKVHPRDKSDYSSYKVFVGDSIEFLSNLTYNDVIISTFSTLAFEVSSLGVNVEFILYQSTRDIYKNLYEKYGIKYKLICDDLDISNLVRKIKGSQMDRIPCEYNLFGNINLLL